AQKEEIPGRPMIETFVANKKELLQEYDTITKFYLEKDKKFELWFPSLGVENSAEEPPGAKFASILTDQIKKIKEELTLSVPDQKKWPLAGAGKPDDFERVLAFVVKSQDGLKVVQKSWWMFEQVFVVCKKNNVHRITSCTWTKPSFDETILGKTAIATTDGTPPVDEIVFGYTTFPMNLKLELPYASVSLLIEELLSASNDTKVMFGLQEIKIARAEMKKEHLGKVEVFWEKYPIASEEELALQKALKKIQAQQESTQKDVAVEIEFFAYDFFSQNRKIPVEKKKNE
ncbi:MAG: hypothetical protein AABZ60_23700, partial [Planctomycetota bacterium]